MLSFTQLKVWHTMRIANRARGLNRAAGDVFLEGVTLPWRRLLVATLFGLWCGLAMLHDEAHAWQVPDAVAKVSFSRDIRPILSENCYACHGFDEGARQADLRLDLASGAHDSVIKPGSLTESELWSRINSDDAEVKMPPPESPLALTAEQIGLLGRWIEEGAVYDEHWAFIPPIRPAVPESPEGQDWGSHPIDRFVRQRLVEQGLSPSPRADRVTLLRRLAFDLTGLPPSAEDVQRFHSDTDPTAYDRAVDRLLSSPHFGERLALDWLDAARYADTNGFSIDGGRQQWLWRDWVIQAFNDNLSYDQFIIQQLAGDLLPNATVAQQIATGFQRNNMVTHEGGTIPAENLANYNADRVKTLGEAIMGLTLGCAQCHNHKFDPLTQREYYQFVDFFNGLGDRGLDGDGGVNPAPSIEAKTVLQSDELNSVQTRIQELRDLLARPNAAILQAWETQQQARLANRGQKFQSWPVQLLNLTTPNRGGGFRIEGTHAVRLALGGGLAAYDMSIKLPETTEPIQGVRVVFQPLADAVGGGWGGGKRTGKNGEQTFEKGTFVLTAISATADQVPSEQVNLHQLRQFQDYTASSWETDFPPAAVRDPRNPTGWSPALHEAGPVHFTATFAAPIHVSETPYLTLQLNFGHGQSLIPGHYEVHVYTGVNDDIHVPQEVLAILETPVDQRSVSQNDSLWRYCASDCDELWHERVELANLEERVRVLHDSFSVMVMSASPQPRETFVLHRGDYLQPRDKVDAGVPAFLPPLPSDAPVDRLALARWLTDRRHPLTARVAVNRYWQMMFGRGIVATSADFGAQGQYPSHPELLDWLAVEFQESGWDVKHLMRLIVTSQTYQQSSNTSPELLARDPQNEWLARGARYRLPAELVRDSALQISGLLVPRIGGPSVNPYTPGDPWREVSHYGSTPATSQIFVQEHGEKLYRRSLYTYWKRTAPPTNLTAFDAPNREVCVVARPMTTTPLQSLVLLNDVQFVEASRVFAERILKHATDDRQRIEWAVWQALGRAPEDWEVTRLFESLEAQREHYRQDPEAAKSLLGNGESRRDLELEVTEHAAWSMVASLILNLSETITRH
ncbi:MAG: PSD1 and planctomycete cytochrome C domain-containing protein [Pirellulaceae bacterium]|nr:PSD1 and planctomycete cytochrome C domain-containing protein [Pirellulaceae bacterium]